MPVVESLVTSAATTRRDAALQPIVGDPEGNAKWWVAQSSGNCVLMATSMMIGQLTGKMPTERQITYEAMHTPSDIPALKAKGKMMYWGLKNSNRWAYYDDAKKLLAAHGVSSTITTYSKTDGADEAWAALTATLADPDKAVVVAVYSTTIYNATVWNRGFIPPPKGQPTTHAVLVTGYDPNTDTVYINDSALNAKWNYLDENGNPKGQKLAVPRQAFMAAWGTASEDRTNSYLTMVGQLSENPPPPRGASWVTSAPRRDTDTALDAHWVDHRNDRSDRSS